MAEEEIHFAHNGMTMRVFSQHMRQIVGQDNRQHALNCALCTICALRRSNQYALGVRNGLNSQQVQIRKIRINGAPVPVGLGVALADHPADGAPAPLGPGVAPVDLPGADADADADTDLPADGADAGAGADADADAAPAPAVPGVAPPVDLPAVPGVAPPVDLPAVPGVAPPVDLPAGPALDSTSLEGIDCSFVVVDLESMHGRQFELIQVLIHALTELMKYMASKLPGSRFSEAELIKHAVGFPENIKHAVLQCLAHIVTPRFMIRKVEEDFVLEYNTHSEMD